MTNEEQITDFEIAWNAFEQQGEFTPEANRAIRGIYMAGGYAAVSVLSNRLAKLPGTVDPGDMVKELINTIEVAIAELERKANEDLPNKTHGTG